LRYSALQRVCAFFIELCDTDASAYLGFDIETKPGHG
jgi:hypothetical protein